MSAISARSRKPTSVVTSMLSSSWRGYSFARVGDMIRARVFAICCGYEDADDLDDGERLWTDLRVWARRLRTPDFAWIEHVRPRVNGRTFY